jgi:H+/Cl- antiporter ClcA
MLVVEMTNSQALLVPLLIATSTAGYVTHRLHLVDEK